MLQLRKGMNGAEKGEAGPGGTVVDHGCGLYQAV